MNIFMPLAAPAKPSDAPGAPSASASGYYQEPSYGGQWPDCWGRCTAGACALDKTKPGCCRLNTRRQGSSYDGPYGSYGGGSHPYADAEGYRYPDREPEHYSGREEDGYGPREGYYKGDEHKGDLVCWGDRQT